MTAAADLLVMAGKGGDAGAGVAVVVCKLEPNNSFVTLEDDVLAENLARYRLAKRGEWRQRVCCILQVYMMEFITGQATVYRWHEALWKSDTHDIYISLTTVTDLLGTVGAKPGATLVRASHASNFAKSLPSNRLIYPVNYILVAQGEYRQGSRVFACSESLREYIVLQTVYR